MIRVLGISGSLRSRSSNTDVLRAVISLAPAGVDITLFAGLGLLPHFNPDLDGEGAVSPPRVADFRDRVHRADALIVCSPEYAHGVPGTLKNALDWLVSDSRVVGKPVALLNASPRSMHATASLAETLRTMSLAVNTAASITLPVTSRVPSAAAMAQDPAYAAALRGSLDLLVQAAIEYRARPQVDDSSLRPNPAA